VSINIVAKFWATSKNENFFWFVDLAIHTSVLGHGKWKSCATKKRGDAGS
jgi:hypothetical protein